MSGETISESKDTTSEEKTDLKIKFLTQLNDKSAIKDSPVVLECSIQSSTSAPIQVKWFKNGIQLQNNYDYEQTENNQHFQLIIRKVLIEDKGIYSVEVSNEIHRISSTCQLSIYENYVHVEQEKAGISIGIITTDDISSCLVVLIDGLFYQSPFAYLKHSSWTPKFPSSSSLSSVALISHILIDLADSIRQELKISFDLTEEPNLKESIKNLVIVVSGGEIKNVDAMRDAFYLLYNKTNLIHIINSINNMNDEKLVLKYDAIYLCQELINNISIIKATTNGLSVEKEDAYSKVENPNAIESVTTWMYINYNYYTKLGYAGIRFQYLRTTINLALMHINLLKKDQFFLTDKQTKEIIQENNLFLI
ncbi:unnamed protein product [Rotaria sordida]|uniref:Ig-like domain-containing protein n=1 Tax=Rotaria sordida TaxID=392033 RepID=A0A815J9U6_9BILA|nr:unnamed protein product [Rotaria sordida]CAF1379480.1 unnamed protein product [Rotaria sordida]